MGWVYCTNEQTPAFQKLSQVRVNALLLWGTWAGVNAIEADCIIP